ncbi:hypothetical protein PGT21_021973 [Puccinia graminis f. sp. tritici]|uniref:Uncharacterized protein n=1 Tax=Puccinia graminis f. sp. tritici TaxID=56615 RepID=A0A5B0PFG5_PUCGR|nr:hypothetical protein PGTUg99_033559 [Puccinia graminis f. sp. tritici]KAA1099823.1 hypothetical protein PGT21_021973 [Puccinia graminis f. sp. tritici]
MAQLVARWAHTALHWNPEVVGSKLTLAKPLGPRSGWERPGDRTVSELVYRLV